MTMPQLMTKEEIHEFGLQILSRYLEANAYEIEMMHPNICLLYTSPSPRDA